MYLKGILLSWYVWSIMFECIRLKKRTPVIYNLPWTTWDIITTEAQYWCFWWRFQIAKVSYMVKSPKSQKSMFHMWLLSSDENCLLDAFRKRNCICDNTHGIQYKIEKVIRGKFTRHIRKWRKVNSSILSHVFTDWEQKE